MIKFYNNKNLLVIQQRMYRDSRSPPQPRSFSFSNWDSREINKADKKLYYNYNNKQDKPRNQYRGDIPSFGDSKGYQSKTKYSNDYQYSFELERKIKPEYQTMANYSMERRESNRAQSYGSKKAWQQNSFQIGRSYDKVGQGCYNKSVSRMEFEKATEQKLSNIDKINEKIKKILNTLNEEEKKISHHHHLKIGHKKSNKYGYAHRIKTEGDDYRYQQNQYQNTNTYDKFLGAAHGFANQQQFSSSSDLLKQLDMDSNYDTAFKFSNNQYPRATFQKTNVALEAWNKQINVEFSQNDRTLSQIKDYQVSMNKQKKRADAIDNSYKLLKGTNVKSTDSLNLSMSICCKNQKENEIGISFKQGSRDQTKHHAKETALNQTNKLGNHQPLEDKKNQRPQNTYSYSYSTQQDSKKEYKSDYQPIKTQNNFNELKQYENKIKTLPTQFQKKQTASFNGFEDMKRIERTPAKSRLEKSLSKYDRSEKSCKLSNGKDLDEEIQKIQKKIEDCQQIKKSLNLEDGDGCRKSRTQLNKSINKYKDRFSHSKGKQIKSFESTEKQLKVSIRQNLVAQFKTENQQLNRIKQMQNNFVSNGRQNVEVEVSLPKPFKMCSRKNTKRTEMCSQVKQIESAFISQDRSELNKQPMRQLIQLICTQIDLDTNFRNSKKWFNRKVNSCKWKQLDRQLQNKNILTNQEQNRKIFTLTQEEDNPFYTERDDQGSYADLVKNFIDSQKHWLDKIQKKFACEEIGQHIQEMDIYGRGIITIEDLVRYINLQSDKYYRNRDLSLIYKRFAGHSQKATVDNILSQLCQM